MKINYTNKNESKTTRKRGNNKLQSMLDEFMARSETYMCLTYEENDGYKDINSMYTAFYHAVRRSGYAIRMWKDKDQIWFEKIVKPKSP